MEGDGRRSLRRRPNGELHVLADDLGAGRCPYPYLNRPFEDDAGQMDGDRPATHRVLLGIDHPDGRDRIDRRSPMQHTGDRLVARPQRGPRGRAAARSERRGLDAAL